MNLKWDEIDFMDCLEVFPEVEEDGLTHLYKVTKDGITLTVVVRQFESLILLSLSQQQVKTPLTEFALIVREAVHYIQDKQGQYLEFQDCVIVPSHFSYPSNDLFDKRKFDSGLTLQVAIKPHIQIRYVRA